MNKRRRHLGEISTQIDGEAADARANPKFAINLTSTVTGGTCGGAKAARDGVLAVDALGGLLGLKDELLEAIVGGPPRVSPSLAGLDAIGEAVEVAALEGLHLQEGGGA